MTQPAQYPTRLRKVDAYERPPSLLGDAIAALRALGDEPVIVASCPARFNNADWRAIRVGSFLSERQDYTGRPETHDKRLREGAQSSHAANFVLNRLETADWCGLHQKAFDRDYVSPTDAIALVIQNDEALLVRCDRYIGESAVYLPSKRLVQIGCCDRAKPFDRSLDEISALTVRSILNAEAADHSHSLSPTEFV